VLLATRGGNGFVCQAGDLLGRNKAGRQMMSLDEGDGPIRPWLFGPDESTVVCLGGTPERPRWLVFGLVDVKLLRSGGRGTRLMDLEADEALLQVVVCGAGGIELSGIGRGAKAMTRSVSARELGDYAGARGRKGKLLEPRWKDAVMSKAPR
jgi:topoisomerase-4 subunit A